MGSLSACGEWCQQQKLVGFMCGVETEGVWCNRLGKQFQGTVTVVDSGVPDSKQSESGV